MTIGGRNETGFNQTKLKSEVISLEMDVECNQIPTLQNPLFGASSGLINDLPTICGGQDSDYEHVSYCIKYDPIDNAFKTLPDKVKFPVRYSAYAPWQNGQENSIIMVGGFGGGNNERYDTVQVVGTDLNWTFPLPVSHACMVLLNNGSYLLTGGSYNSDTPDKTFVFTIENNHFEWSNGPKMNGGRQDHMCALMKDDNHEYVVVFSGYPSTIDPQCEYLEIVDNQLSVSWQRCSGLPESFTGGQLITDPQSGDLILIGGFEDIISDTIYRLSSINGEWMLQNKRLQEARHLHVSMFVPDSKLTQCELASKVSHDEL